MIELRLFGRLSLTGPDGREQPTLLGQPRRFALLAYLAGATPQGLHRRDSLVALFWPELDQEHARTALRQALRVLRATLGPAALVTRGDEEIGLDFEQVWCDVAAFDGALDRTELREALDFYRGPLLDGFFISDAPEFERWLEEQRAHLRHRATDAAWACAERAERDGAPGLAVEFGRRAMALAPDDERVLAQFIGLLDRQGDRAGAVRAYDEFAQRLARDLEVEPSPETKALIAAVRSREAKAAGSEPGLPSPAPGTAAPQTQSVAHVVLRRPRRRAWFAGAGIAAAGVIGTLAFLRAGAIARLSANRVVVAAFLNQTGDTTLDQLGKLTGEWLSRALTQTGLVEVADPGFPLPEVGGPRQSPASPAGDAVAARRLAIATGSGLAVWGSFYRRGDSLEFAAQITDERRGRLLRSVEPVIASESEPRPALATLRQRVLGVLATTLDPKLNDWVGLASQPPSYEAYQAFAAGLAAFNRPDLETALQEMYRSAALDSTFTLPLAWAAWVHRTRRECDKVLALGRRFAGRPLPAVDRVFIDREVASCQGDLDAVYRVSHEIAEALPASELMEELLAQAALRTNRPREAVEILRRLHPDRRAMQDRRPYYYLWLTAAYHLLGEHDQELAAARRAHRLLPTDLSMLRLEVLAQAALGHLPELNALLDEIPALPPHPFRTPVGIVREAALELQAHGHQAAASDVFDRAVAWFDTRPPEERLSEPSRRERLRTLFFAGRWEAAGALVDTLVREHPDSATYQGIRGALAARRKDSAGAARADSSLIELKQVPPHWPTYWRACIAAQLGERRQAVDQITQAHREGRELTTAYQGGTGVSLHADPCFESLRGDPAFRELLRPKG